MFLKRNKMLKRVASNIKHSRLSVDLQVINEYFDEFETTFQVDQVNAFYRSFLKIYNCIKYA